MLTIYSFDVMSKELAQEEYKSVYFDASNHLETGKFLFQLDNFRLEQVC